MSVADALRAAAVKIFDNLTGVPIQGNYIKREADYVPGGNNQIVETSYPLRFIKDKSVETGGAEADTKSKDERYMFVTAELEIVASTKDMIELEGIRYVILDKEDDAVGAVTTLTVRSA